MAAFKPLFALPVDAPRSEMGGGSSSGSVRVQLTLDIQIPAKFPAKLPPLDAAKPARRRLKTE